MHSVDFINCTQGGSSVDDGAPFCPNIAALANNGVNFLDAHTSKPSDSFPDLMIIVTGGSPRLYGAFYDVAYDRSLDPPAETTGNRLAGAPDLCKAGAAPTGTTTEYEEGVDIDQTKLNGGAPERASRTAASRLFNRNDWYVIPRIIAVPYILGIY